MPQNTGHLYEFGPFLLDTAQHLLTREGQAVPLTPKTYDMLVVLVESSGRMLTKSELMKALWPDSFVEESNLTQQVSVIRKALGESPGQDRYIVTVPGRGYRFAASVSERSEAAISPLENRSGRDPVIEDAGVDAASRKDVEGVSPGMHFAAGAKSDTPAAETPSTRLPRQILILALALLAATLLAFGFIEYRKNAAKDQLSAGPRSLAVLPFQSLRNDTENDFLGVSLADAVITKLGYVSSITVRPSSAVTKYRNQVIDIRKVAGDLHVDTLLTGNFIRDGDDLRITSQLVEVKTQSILWKGAFDLKFERLLTVQDSVAGQIIKGLELSLSPQEVERLKPDNQIDPLAYEYYLRGVDLYTRNEFPLAIKMLKKSAEIDSSYALTWAHLGRTHTANASFELGGRDEYREAQAAYEKALALQRGQIEAQIYMANLFTDTGRVERAVPLIRDALKTNPNHAEAHWELGYAYRYGGMLHESVSESERARQLDPGVKLTSSTLNGYLYLGQYDKFLESLPKSSESALILFYRGFGEYYKKDRAGAARDFDSAFEMRPSLLQAKVGKALSDAIGNRNSKGIGMLSDTASKIADLGVGDPEAVYKIAQAYAVLGDKTSALRLLGYSIQNGFFCYPYLTTDPLMESLHGEGEFTRLMASARQRHEAFKSMFFGNPAGN